MNHFLLDMPMEDVNGWDVFQELKMQYQLLSSPDIDLEERLEAFDHITDSEVGDTPLLRARNVERDLGIRQVFLKFEGGNPTGTQKDRIAFAQAKDALRRGFDTMTLATCGNYGVACALACRAAGLRAVIFIPRSYHTKRIKEMEDLGAEIMREGDDYEGAVAASQAYAERMELYDANPGGNNTVLQLQAYGEIAYEIYDELRDAPRIIAAPVSNGTMLAGIYRGFVSLYRRGKTSRVPHIVAGSAAGQNPIVYSFRQGLAEYADLAPERIRETATNEPLINWHSFDGELLLDAIRRTQGWATDVTDKRLLAMAKLLREREGLNVLPAATAGLAALADPEQRERVQQDRFVALLTSRK